LSHTEGDLAMSKICLTFALGIYISAYTLLGFSQEPHRMEFLMSKPRPKLIIFSADWCSPCNAAKKAMKENVSLKRIVDSYEVIQYDFDIAIPMRRKYKVDRVPTFIVVTDGEEIKRQTGFSSEEKLKNFLD
jgi:thiol-disulfide isomerase/thioredoxin